jgi:hypothetical protein
MAIEVLRSTFEPYVKSWGSLYTEQRKSKLTSEFAHVLTVIIKGDEVVNACKELNASRRLKDLNTAIAAAQVSFNSSTVKISSGNETLRRLVEKVKLLYQSSPVTIAHSASAKKTTEHKAARSEVKAHSPPPSAAGTPPKPLIIGAAGGKGPSRTPTPEGDIKEHASFNAQAKPHSPPPSAAGTPPKPMSVDARIIGAAGVLGKGPSRAPTPPISEADDKDHAEDYHPDAILVASGSNTFAPGAPEVQKVAFAAVSASMDNVEMIVRSSLAKMGHLSPAERRAAYMQIANTLATMVNIAKLTYTRDSVSQTVRVEG